MNMQMDAVDFADLTQSVDYTIDSEINRLNDVASSLFKEVDSICLERNRLIFQVHEFKQHLAYQKSQMSELPGDLQSKLSEMQSSLFAAAATNQQMSNIWIQSVVKVLVDLKAIKCRVTDTKVTAWKREQQLANNGCTLQSADYSLERIHRQCSDLCDLLSRMRKMLTKCLDQVQTVEFIVRRSENNGEVSLEQQINSTINMVDEEIISLMKSSFVIEKQPPQVMKTNIRFVASVALLAGNSFNCSAESQPPEVHAYIVNEHEASHFLENPRPFTQEPKRSAGTKDAAANEILNNKATLELNASLGIVMANFRNMQLKRIKRTEKKGTESVMDEKFAILFTSSLRLPELPYEIFVWAMSLPVVVIVHGNQEPRAWATITWDNAFAEASRKSFKVAESVPWHLLAQVLDMKFKYYVNLRLEQDDLLFLACKILRKDVAPTDLQDQLVSWNLFAKDNLCDRPFTFWEWFFAILKVSRDPLKIFFQDKSIIKFLSRQQTQDMLFTCATGTFLLRFSDSELGGVTIAWVGENQEVFMVQPFTARDFAIRGLADRIGDLKHLTYLYPNIPKDQVFGKYYSQDQTPKANGYVKPVLALTLLGYVDHNQTTHPPDHSSSPHPLLLSHRMDHIAKSPVSSISECTGYLPKYPECSSESSSVSSVVPDYPTIEYTSNSTWNSIHQSEIESNFIPTFPYS